MTKYFTLFIFIFLTLCLSVLQKISENPPTFIRISIGNMVYEKELPAKTGKQIADAAKCIMQ